jgi:hypothetical protein
MEGGPSISSCLADGDAVVDAEQQAMSNRLPTRKKERLIKNKSHTWKIASNVRTKLTLGTSYSTHSLAVSIPTTLVSGSENEE